MHHAAKVTQITVNMQYKIATHSRRKVQFLKQFDQIDDKIFTFSDNSVIVELSMLSTPQHTCTKQLTTILLISALLFVVYSAQTFPSEDHQLWVDGLMFPLFHTVATCSKYWTLFVLQTSFSCSKGAKINYFNKSVSAYPSLYFATFNNSPNVEAVIYAQPMMSLLTGWNHLAYQTWLEY